MGSYIKFQLKKAISLVLVYGLILGGFSFAAPFIGTQRIYAEVGGQTESESEPNTDIIDNIPFGNENSVHETVELVAGDFYRVRVFVAEEESMDPVKVDNDNSYIEATVGLQTSLKNYIAKYESYPNPIFLTLLYDTILIDGMSAEELANVGCGNSYDWLSDGESSETAIKEIKNGSDAEATFCYFANTVGDFVIDFNANIFEPNELKMSVPITVAPRKITVDLGDLEKTYGDDYPGAWYEIVKGPLIYGDSGLEDFYYDLELADGANREDVGVYKIIPSPFNIYNNKNYEISFTDRYLTIKPTPLTIRANNVSKKFGEPDPALTYTIIDGNLMFDDDLAGSLARVKGEDARKEAYEIGIGTLASSNPNYIIGFVAGEFTIVERPVVQAVKEAPIAVSETDTSYDRVGVVDTGEPKSASTVKVKDSVKVKKEEIKKNWTILGLAWYWWVLAISALGGLTWWFSPNNPTKADKTKK